MASDALAADGAAFGGSRGDIAKLVEMLQTPRKTIYDKLAKYDLKPARFRANFGHTNIRSIVNKNWHLR